MAKEAQSTGTRSWSGWRIAGWSVAALLLLLPLAAMQLTDEVTWTGFDFAFMAVVFGLVGLGLEFLVRKSGSLAYRVGGVVALVVSLLTIVVNGAVGMIGSEGNPYNLLFGGVLAIALIGAIVARFGPGGMARAMAAAAIAQAALGALGLPTDPLGGVCSMAFAAPWLLAAVLFRKAAWEQVLAGEAS